MRIMMKRILGLTPGLFLLLSALPMSGHNAVKLIDKDSKETIFMLSDHPRVTFNDEIIVVRSAKEEISCDMADGTRFEFLDYDQNSIGSIPGEAVMINLTGNNLEGNLLAAGSPIRIANIAGQVFVATQTDDSGYFRISLENLAPGVYVFSSQEKIFKFYKK